MTFHKFTEFHHVFPQSLLMVIVDESQFPVADSLADQGEQFRGAFFAVIASVADNPCPTLAIGKVCKPGLRNFEMLGHDARDSFFPEIAVPNIFLAFRENDLEGFVQL
jgi:hypothetical protein